MNSEKIHRHLLENGIKPSYQRLKIFEYLITKKSHPTVEEIYKHLLPHIPTLSKTTVYNTVSLFVDKGLAIQISMGDKESRYDAIHSIHGHFKCKICGNLYDINMEVPFNEINDLEGFEIQETQVNLKGICKNCSKNNMDKTL